MSQEQPQRAEEHNNSNNNNYSNEAIKYGEVFKNVSGELASKAIIPRDAATVQSVESQILGGPAGRRVVGQYVEDDDVANKGGTNIDNEIGPKMDADAPATMQAPQVKANTQDHHDFINSTSDPTTLNPRLSLSGSNQHDSTLSNVSTDNRETSRLNPNVVISSVPGGMGASMATADQTLTKNK